MEGGDGGEEGGRREGGEENSSATPISSLLAVSYRARAMRGDLPDGEHAQPVTPTPKRRVQDWAYDFEPRRALRRDTAREEIGKVFRGLTNGVHKQYRRSKTVEILGEEGKGEKGERKLAGDFDRGPLASTGRRVNGQRYWLAE